MAELIAGPFLSSVFQVTLERLASTDFRNRFHKGLVKKLEITLNSINQVLDEAEKKQYQSTYVKKWLDDLKHEVYEVDQLLDEIATSAQRKRKDKVRHCVSSFTSRFESRIEELLEKLEFLGKQKDVLGLKEGTCSSSSNEGGVVSWKSSERLPTTSLVDDESAIYGRDGDKEEIINFLLSDDHISNRAPIISIVGLGGMGKTTLVQLVYNDQRVQEEFELTAWVYVSESFDVVGLTKAILRSFHFSADGDDLNLLQHQLRQRLMGKRYLIVLDDVWNRNGGSWELLQLPFNHGSPGSKIIVTTRSKEVALVVKSTKLLELKKLEENDCWSLFVRHAFHDKNVSEFPNLESTGKKIVDKCGGLPLAVRTLGNLLRIKFSLREWVKILETDVWRLLDVDSNINAVLRWSYHNLPSNLKRCFAYCAMFPKDYKFDKDRLIKCWMAEGLLKCCGIDKSEEELGNEFFDDLKSISFFEQSVYQWGDKYFVMHDLVNDLAKSVSGEFCLQVVGDDRVQDIPERTRHVLCFLESNDSDKILKNIYKIRGLRSLMVQRVHQVRICNNVQHNLYSRLKYLRMLSFYQCYLSELVDAISNLKLLRYLDLTLTGIRRLPDSICMLYNLETLILKCCPLTKLPSKFYKLVNLRHLNLEYTDVKKMPKKIGRLNHLQTLTPHFIVGEHSGSDIKELMKLNHLEGTLSIEGLENVIDPADAVAANLKDKKHLEELCMLYVGSREIDDSIIQKDFSVLEGLQPNSNLNRLTIKGYCGSSFPNWLGDSHLSNLVSLNLWECGFCSQLPPLGKLPSLKMLSIGSCLGIVIIGPEFYDNNSSNVSFRSLEILRFEDMLNWKEWLCLEGFPLLKELSIRFCPKLKRALPQHLLSLQKLEIVDCYELEASLPMAANISQLELSGCENILLNELPSSLKSAFLHGNWFTESSYMEKIPFNNAFLEELYVRELNGPHCAFAESSLDLHISNSLCSLSIRGWHSTSLPFALHLFTNLHSLKLYDCPWLESLHWEDLPLSLSSLLMYNCPKLIASREEWDLFRLNSLREFDISDDFENVESFPEESLLPPTTISLRLENCSKLRIINYKGLLHLKSLESLSILDCPCLERLPEEGLPDSLSTLDISGCSLLKPMYQKEVGEHWNKIQHIPSVIIESISR